MNQEHKDLLNEVGVNKFFEIALTESVKSEGYTSIEDYAGKRLTNEPEPLTEVQELKIDLEFSRFELWVVQDELDATKQKLASFNATPAPVLDITMFNSMMNQFNTINEKLTPVANFFAAPAPEPTPAKKRISKKEKERITFEKHKKMLRMETIEKIKNGG